MNAVASAVSFFRVGIALAFAVLLAVTSCGARTHIDGELESTALAPTAVDAGTRADVQDATIPTTCSRDSDCNDRIDCTADHCVAGKCEPKPDDSRCGLSQACEVGVGCESRAWAIVAETVYDVRLPSGRASKVGKTDAPLSDIALAPNGTLYAVAGAGLLLLERKGDRWHTESIELDVDLPMHNTGGWVITNGDAWNALEVGANGIVYAAGRVGLWALDVARGTGAKVVDFPSGYSSSGDLARLGGRLFAAAVPQNVTGDRDDRLIEFDVDRSTARVIGSTGFRCLHGLAALGKDLYGFSCSGEIVTIDLATGRGTLLRDLDRAPFDGATAR